ncbi:putative membrane attack complex component/perforin (MACPF) domain-containing protein [Rosa chinensis]|uniref:Putative membrane attack complex component/perforin (MACPF) domain-containing protein n=1 Tax=Rosa chinensis TaxID=74649 RepID=A0A2P6Q484_ROSCH|nr:MACPF domain-containing protein NSL1 [Rosa chinensis]PRQ28992.1 putative membrane attack complex component/perforin (MACPF) domain-containing protein [Rosa chinensis]
MALSVYQRDPQWAAKKAVAAIGSGYDFCNDLRFTSCKSVLIELDPTRTRDLVIPGGPVVPDVSTSIKCDKGERAKFRSDVVSFNQMSEQYNKELSLSGKIPSGLFNAMFNYTSCWQKDAAPTKCLAFDGWLITLYNIELARSQLTLSEQVKQDVPSVWDPAGLAAFIEKYGTHIVVGVKMGGKDIVHVKQLQNSKLEPAELQKLLKQLAEERFSDNANESSISNTADLLGKMRDDHPVHWDIQRTLASSVRQPIITHSRNDDIVTISVRRGGVDVGQSHNQWLSTISQAPDVISMSFVPITSLLGGVQGNGFLSHAVNLYLRYKPPIEELQQFLEFQLPRQWAPVYADLPLGLRRRRHASPSLQFSFMGPKLYVNTMKVDSVNRPVTGIRLYLEGKKGDHMAIHLQHLTSLPSSFQVSTDHNYEPIDEPEERGYFEPVKWSIFSHVCTAPVQYNGACINDSASIVTKAWFEVKAIGMRKVLFLRLGFSTVASARIRRSEWEGSSSSRKSGFISTLISTRLSAALNPPVAAPPKVDLNSAVYPGGPPLPSKAPKMATFVDTKEMLRGPEDTPGYWMVTGAKLCVEGGRISVKVKYSLLTIMSEDSMMF